MGALTGRMRSAGWTTREVLNLIAFFPFGRASESERFHAYWTRRLRDKSDTSGRPSLAEVTKVATSQHDLWPAPSPPTPEPVPADVVPSNESGAQTAVAQAPTPESAQDLPSSGNLE